MVTFCFDFKGDTVLSPLNFLFALSIVTVLLEHCGSTIYEIVKGTLRVWIYLLVSLELPWIITFLRILCYPGSVLCFAWLRLFDFWYGHCQTGLRNQFVVLPQRTDLSLYKSFLRCLTFHFITFNLLLAFLAKSLLIILHNVKFMGEWVVCCLLTEDMFNSSKITEQIACMEICCLKL